MKKLLLAGSVAATLIFGATSPTLQSEPVTAHAASKYYFKNNVAKLTDIKIKIIKKKVIKPGKTGNEYGDKSIIVFWYKTTNITGKTSVTPISAWLAVFDAYQDNNKNYLNQLDIAGTGDERYYNTQSKVIKKGGTVTNSIAYELSDNKTPVTLVATKGYDGTKLGSKKYKVK